MPKIPKQTKKACWNCRFYKLGQPGGPFCAFFKRVFPEYNKWTRDPSAKKPGERVCKNWKDRGGYK